MFNKNLEEIKNRQSPMNDTITEIKKKTYARENQQQNNQGRRMDK